MIYNHCIDDIRIPAMLPTIKRDTAVYLHSTTENHCPSPVPEKSFYEEPIYWGRESTFALVTGPLEADIGPRPKIPCCHSGVHLPALLKLSAARNQLCRSYKNKTDFNCFRNSAWTPSVSSATLSCAMTRSGPSGELPVLLLTAEMPGSGEKHDFSQLWGLLSKGQPVFTSH